jgi:hypothetical protein
VRHKRWRHNLTLPLYASPAALAAAAAVAAALAAAHVAG